MSMDEQKLHDFIERKKDYTYRSDKASIVDYYKEQYTGAGTGGRGLAWKQHLIGDLLGAKDITPASVGDKEYKRLSHNMSKRFDPQRLNVVEKKTSGEYKALGQALPPTGFKVKDGGFTITVNAKQENGTRERSWSTSFTGTDAFDFSSNPTYRAFFKHLSPTPYPDDVIDDFDGDDSGSADVTSVV